MKKFIVHSKIAATMNHELSSMNHLHVSPLVLTFHPVNEGAIHYFIAAGGRIIAAEIPVAGMARAGFVQVIKGLIDHFNFAVYFFWSDDLCYPVGYFLVCKRLINCLHIIGNIFFWQCSAIFTLLLNFEDCIFLAGIFQ